MSRNKGQSKATKSVGDETLDKEEKCNDCMKLVGESEKGLQCEACESWFHTVCQKMDQDTYKLMGQECIHWFCKSCDKSVAKLFKALGTLKIRQDKMEENMDKELRGVKRELDGLRKEIETLRGEKGQLNKAVDEIKRTIDKMGKDQVQDGGEVDKVKKVVEDIKEENVQLRKTWADMLGGGLAAGVQPGVVVMSGTDRNIQEKVSEVMEREKRRNKLIVMGIKEKEGEMDEKGEIVENIVKELMNGEYCKVEVGERIGKIGSKCRPVRITVDDLGKRRKLLARAKSLKEAVGGLEKFYIVPDLTRQQQELDKKLRDKLKTLRQDGVTDIKINRGEIIKGQGQSKEVLFSINSQN